MTVEPGNTEIIVNRSMGGFRGKKKGEKDIMELKYNLKNKK